MRLKEQSTGGRQAPSFPNSNDSGSANTSNYTNNNHTENRSSPNIKEGNSQSRHDRDTAGWHTTTPGASSNSNSNDDPNGTKAYEQSADGKSSQTKPEKKSPKELNTESELNYRDDDEDYNIYSDIEVSQDPDSEHAEVENVIAKENHDEESSDAELVIDEDRRTIAVVASESRMEGEDNRKLDNEQVPNQSPTASPVNNFSSFDGVPSPDSIPLPDSTPPPATVHDEDPDSDNSPEECDLDGTENLSVSVSSNDRSNFAPQIATSAGKSKEEYDPSQPLTSSDEEEHSSKLSSTPKLPIRSADRRIPTGRLTNAQKDDDDSDVDLSSIPMPSDDYRRPTIQFSIPTRHKLLSISSLIKRQRGVAKKENKNALSFASEVSKAFGEDKNDESDEDSLHGNDGGSKVSLVAEIFGSDDEEERDEKNVDDSPNAGPGGISENESPASLLSTTVPTIVVPCEVTELEDTGSLLSPPPIDIPRWKKIVTDLPELNSEILSASIVDEQNQGDSDDSIAVVETIQRRQKGTDNDIQVLSISKAPPRNKRGAKIMSSNPKPIEKERPSLLESISDGDSEFEPGSPKTDSTADAKRKVRKDSGRDAVKEVDKKQLKRKRSATPALNREEGEIVDSPEKRRKKKKEKKKGKRRRKSKEDKSRFHFAEKKIDDGNIVAQNSSEEENKSERVPWKKPSNSTKERNYRNGKPKPEEKYFKTSYKKKDASPRGHAEKATTEDLHFDKGKPAKDKLEARRDRRRSASPRSRSRSLSATRNVARRFNSRSRRSTSTNRSYLSRSRSRSLRRSRKRGRFSVSPPRRTRSGSRGSPRVRSRSPLKPQRNRHRSSSLNYSRRHKGGRRSESSSSSTSSKRERRRRRDKLGGRDKTKKPREKDRSNEKVQDLKDPKDKDKDREKDKDKKKRKKRREKSVSPAKEIFADGDSIVVSLNFQKSNPSGTTDGTPSRKESEGDKKKPRNRARHNRPNEAVDTGKPRLLKKTLLIDLESSPVQEQNIGVSPTLIVLSDDEDADPSHKKGSEPDLKEHGKDGISVTTTSVNGQKTNNMSPHRLGAAADSTQLQHSSAPVAKLDGSFNPSICTSISPSENSNLSPARGDALVTSTRDSENGIHLLDESRSPSRSPSSKGGRNNIHQPHSPAGSPPPLPSGTPPSLHGNDSRTMENMGGSSGGLLTTGSSALASGKPLIGNIPGLFPSSGISSYNPGILSAPPPLVIPVPPAPQVRFPTSMNQNLFTTNVLASMASALYAPILAARQQQQTISTGKYPSSNMNSVNSSGNKSSANNSVLLPKSQNTHGSGSRSKSGNNITSTGEGDSPFSPNSSDGDDLFEPPLDRSQGDSATPSKTDKLSASQSTNPTPSSASTTSGNAAKPREKSSLFDSLFGGAPKKSSHQRSHGKSSKGKGSGGHHKSKSKKTKKEIVKLTEGELRLTEDVPNSAVELRVKEKFLMKLNRQDRVVEEVKLSLKPHYSKKHVTKDEYKEILRRAVPKICHSKSGEINPSKIKELVEVYVNKFRHARKKE